MKRKRKRKSEKWRIEYILPATVLTGSNRANHSSSNSRHGGHNQSAISSPIKHVPFDWSTVRHIPIWWPHKNGVYGHIPRSLIISLFLFIWNQLVILVINSIIKERSKWSRLLCLRYHLVHISVLFKVKFLFNKWK